MVFLAIVVLWHTMVAVVVSMSLICRSTVRLGKMMVVASLWRGKRLSMVSKRHVRLRGGMP